MKKLFISLLIFLSVSTRGQNLDSLYNEFLSYKGRIVSTSHHVAVEQKEKCGFGLAASIMINYDKFTPKQKNVLSSLLIRPVCDTSIISPKKLFKIYFHKSGINIPAYDINEFAKAADSSYTYEVNVLGYPAPPNDPDGYYPIYLDSLNPEYGVTWNEKKIDSNTWTSYIVVSNNFDSSNYYTHGIDAARVTIAHEFHHAIQMGNYIYSEEDRIYHEITSTSMEGYVFDSIKDYYQSLNSYFQSPDNSFNAYGTNTGYNLAIWHFYLTSKFGMNIIKEIWEKMPHKRAMECMSEVLENHGTTLLNELNQFGVWTYFTNKRSIPGKYFKDAVKYPLIKSSMTTQFKNPTTLIHVTSNAISNNFLTTIDGSDTLVSIITNADVQGLLNEHRTIDFDLSISKSPLSGFGNIDHGFYSKLSSANLYFLKDSYLYNNNPANKTIKTDYAFPQPFNYSKYSTVYFPSEVTFDGKADLNIFSIDMNLVFSNQLKISTGEKVVVPWNVLDNNGKRLGSGVYIYVVKCGDNIFKGKFVVLND